MLFQEQLRKAVIRKNAKNKSPGRLELITLFSSIETGYLKQLFHPLTSLWVGAENTPSAFYPDALVPAPLKKKCPG